ncbi:putative ankyrin repeat domain-containing protein 31 [Lonchura striata]|uniref:Ankyrin repeat domain-containing protein 31 n=1 Tax=Lonchura striata TaxID=40157 RepID=A0A218VA25_9PASE|nr:putative ankyrin repeat domain-containing protein 31 [Lonchura striata domestica]
MAAAAEGGARPPEGPPAERGRHSDTDSDETVVEGSVTESDVEEEEFHRRRLAFLNEDVALTTEISINKGTFSPEISFVQKYGGHKYYDKAEQINPISRKLSNKDCCPEISLCRHDPVEDITVQEEQILEDTFPHGLDNCHRTCMTIIDTDNTVKEHSFNNDTDLSLSSLGKIFMDVFTEQNIETSEVDISDLLRYPSDSESLKVENPLPDKLECQGHSCSVNPSAAESNDALPVELVAPLNALSASMVQAATPVVPNERQLNAKKEQLNSETSVLQVDDDYTQITNVMEPQLATIQAEEINAFTGSNLQSTTNEQVPLCTIWDEVNIISEQLFLFTSGVVVRMPRVIYMPGFWKVESSKSTSEDKQDFESIIWQEIMLNEYAKANQRRRSKRIDEKQSLTALHIASVEGFYRIANLLLKAGADVNATQKEQITPLQDAVKEGHYEIPMVVDERLFISSGGDDSKNMLNTQCVEDTNQRQHGANPNERDGSGESPLNQACDEEMKDLLKSYGAVDSVLPVQTVEVTEGKSKHHCNDCYKNDDAVLETQHEKYSVESAAAIQDTEKKQEELLLFELRTWKDSVTFTMGLGASTPNGNRVEAHVSLENRLSAQECIQHPHICLDEKGANKEAITSKEASDHALASENRVRESAFDMSKLTNAAEVMTLPSKPTISTAKTKCSQQKDIDRIVIVGQKNRFLKPISITNSLNTVEPQSTVVSKNVSQTTNDCKQVLSHQDLHRYVNKKEAVQQQQQPQQEILIASTKNFSNTLQQRVFQSSENSFNANLMLTNLSSNTDSLANISEKSSQSYDNQEWEQKQVRYGWKSKKKYQLIDLLELGRIKPGENVLEFKLQEFTHKATLLKNGKIRTSKGQILQNPVQWVKDLLGSDISVTWKYVWNKVTYLGTELSKFGVDEASFSSDLELPTQKANPFGLELPDDEFIFRCFSNFSLQQM